jgi:hypothetical protein
VASGANFTLIAQGRQGQASFLGKTIFTWSLMWTAFQFTQGCRKAEKPSTSTNDDHVHVNDHVNERFFNIHEPVEVDMSGYAQ